MIRWILPSLNSGSTDNMRHKILNTIGPAFAPEARAILDALGTVEYTVPTEKELLMKAKEYTIIVVGLGLPIGKTFLEKAKNLQLIASVTTGLDHIDGAEAAKRAIPIL